MEILPPASTIRGRRVKVGAADRSGPLFRARPGPRDLANLRGRIKQNHARR